MSTKDHVQAVIDGILAGDILGTFDKYYDDNVIMTENRKDERVGKATNRAYEEGFVNNVEFHGAQVGSIIVDGDKAAVEWTFDFTPQGGQRVQQSQIAVQQWNDGKIVREDFYYNAS